MLVEYQQIPLTPRQKLIWVENSLNPGVPLNIVTTLFDIRGSLNPDAFHEAFASVFARHDALRMSIDESCGEPRLRLLDRPKLPFEFVDLGDNGDLKDWLASRLSRTFAIGGPLFDAALVRIRSERFVFFLNRHHIISDNTSSVILHRHIESEYLHLTSSASGKKLPHSTPSYAQYLHDSAASIDNDRARESEAFWKNRFATKPPPLRFYGGDTTVRSDLFVRRSCTLDTEISRRIGPSGSETPPSAVFTAALFAFLHRVTGGEDLCVGVPLHNRTKASEGIVGLVMEPCPNRVRIEAGDTFEDLLEKIRAEIHDVRPHRSHTVSARQAGYEVLFNFLVNTPTSFAGFEAEYVHTSPLTLLESIDGASGAPRRDREKLVLTVQRAESASTYDLHFDLNGSAFPEAAVRDRVPDHFIAMLRALLDDPTQRIDAADILTTLERQSLLRSTKIPAPSAPTVLDMIQRQTAGQPDRVALLGPGPAVTYQELVDQVEQLAANLRALGVCPGVHVAVCVGRSARMPIILLAVLRAGAAFVPIDQRHPRGRIEVILEDIDPAVILTDGVLDTNLGQRWQARVVRLEDADLNGDWLEDAPRASDLAYIVHTSGSTGRPKGVPITHAQLASFLDAMRIHPGMGANDRVLVSTTIAFDPLMVEVFLPLTVGAAIYVAPHISDIGGSGLAKLLDRKDTTLLQGTPTVFRMLLAAGWEGKKGLRIFCGAEPLSPPLAKSLMERSRELWNLYGPTETTVWATAKRVETERNSITVGTPLPRTSVHVLTPDLSPTPIGTPGEICIGGPRVARGYHGRPELTKGRFVPDPFSPEPGALLYRTGDIGRLRENLELEFIGRADNQVKVRGFRVELEEVEAALASHPAVSACGIAPVYDALGETALVAFVEATPTETPLDLAELRAFVRNRLPDYMTPSKILRLDPLPRTATGKIDRGGLPTAGATSDLTGAASRAEVPSTDLESNMLRIWRDLLETDALGVTDNFFDAGGHSLLAMTLILEVESRLGLRPGLDTLFEHPTVREFCAMIDSNAVSPPAITLPIRRGSNTNTIYCVRGGIKHYTQLGRSIGGDIALEAVVENGMGWLRKLIEDGDVLAVIARLSDAYADAILAHHESGGGLHLAGYSFGGIIAIETAIRLNASGRPPQTVFLFDTRLVNFWQGVFRTEFGRRLRQALRGEGAIMLRRLINAPSAYLGSASHQVPCRKSRTAEELLIKSRRREGSRTYRGPSGPLPCPVVLFRAEQRPDYWPARDDPTNGWLRHLGAALTVIPTPGNHGTLLLDPYVRHIAARIDQQLSS